MNMSLKSGQARQRRSGEVDQILLVAIFATVILVVIGLLMAAGLAHGDSSSFGMKLFVVVAHNMGFWIMITVGAFFGVYRKLANPGAFSWLELPIQLAATTLAILLLYLLFFSTATDLIDTEVWNGYAREAQYHESWTERVTTTTTDNKGHTHTETHYVHHPPHWLVETTVGDISLSSGEYAAYRGKYGHEQKHTEFHSNQSSFGDGNMFSVECDGAGAARTPVSTERSYVNYLRASDSVKKLRGGTEAFRKFLRPYPRVHGGPFGDIELDRVIVADAPVPPAWASDVSRRLSAELETLGGSKEVNVIVYVAGTPDRAFSSALREEWVQGKKNDVEVVLGAPQFPKVDWAEVICWTKVEEFPIALRDRIGDLGAAVSDPDKFVSAVVGEISKPPAQGGYQRTHMRDLQYLVAEIALPWWCQVITVVIGGVVAWFVSVWIVKNDFLGDS